ncbi:MAG: ABC-F family ATP-binding cassette domain-containing protein [Clostridia bacterium]|nr:ABC-F family ATP-binding cassette domain-containing protein [Clostridia bacterium]
MTVISVSNLSLSFGTVPVLQNISFALNENDRLGVVGINGSGKTSLFKLILGEYTPDEGSVFISKDKTVGVLEQNVSLDIADGETPLSFMYSAFP